MFLNTNLKTNLCLRAKSETFLFEDQCSGWYGFFGLVKYTVVNVGTSMGMSQQHCTIGHMMKQQTIVLKSNDAKSRLF